MNLGIIRYILGQVLKLEGLLLLIPALIGLVYREPQGWYYLMTFGFCLLCGVIMTIKKPLNNIFYLKEGCVATASSWILLSLFGCLPFYLSREIPHFTDALFETVSGFTTTGASILNDVEALSHCALFWRSFTHWIGGMGVLVFLMAIIQMSGGSNINLMRAESPGPSVGKLVPKMRYTARILYVIYSVMTVAEIIFLLIGHMPLFDSVTTALGTAGTGGFGIKNDSLGSYSPFIQWVVAIFMILFGINFYAYYLLIFGKIKKALSLEEVRVYLLIILASAAVIFGNILHTSKGIFDALTKAVFQVASVITTTGFSTTDFDLWPQTSQVILVCLMFIGACAGSTGGGIKVSRFMIMFKTVKKELGSYIHPKNIKKINIDGKPVEHEVVRSVNIFIITFVAIFVFSILAVSFEKNTDLVTSFTSVTATLNNIGPGLSMVGPTHNFGFFSVFSKLILIFDMLAGRLELFPLLMLLHPELWKQTVRKIKRPKS